MSWSKKYYNDVEYRENMSSDDYQDYVINKTFDIKQTYGWHPDFPRFKALWIFSGDDILPIEDTQYSYITEDTHAMDTAVLQNKELTVKSRFSDKSVSSSEYQIATKNKVPMQYYA